MTAAKTVVVTGATRGIGRAIADRLAHAGWRVIGTYRRDRGDGDRHPPLAGEIAPAPAIAFVRMDLGSDASVGAAARAIAARAGRLDAIINNAGTTDDGAFLAMEEGRVAALLQANLFGTIRLTRALLPLLRGGSDASVVNIASLAGVAGKEGQVSYAASKGGLIGFTKLLARRTSRTGVRANAVAPGFIATEMTGMLDDGMVRHIVHGTSLRRIGEPEDVADAVTFLLGARYVNGTTIKVDGGFKR